MNHGCVAYNEGGTKIIVAGGVVKTASGQFEVTDSVEVMDWSTKVWRTERPLPRRFTGRFKFNSNEIKVFILFADRFENDQS